MSLLAIGLISGTSADGIDAALVEIEGHGVGTRVEQIAFACVPYPEALRREVLDVSRPGGGSVDRICRLDVVLGEWFARAALQVCESAGVKPESVAFIGSHGQTVHHLPDEPETYGVAARSTLQLGKAAVITERTGATTVSDFRARDMAAGGEGAPLVPMVDYLLFRSPHVHRVMLNVGGIGNVTLLPAGCGPGDVTAFDTGPGNMVLDALVSRFTNGAESYDRDGRRAAEGMVIQGLVDRLASDPYFDRAPPKSTGRELFGDAFVARVLAEGRGATEADLLRSATELTARTVSEAVSRFGNLGGDHPVEVVVSGGGALNPTLMAALVGHFPAAKVLPIDELGIGAECKEAVAFAVLGNETLAGQPGNLPTATGAARSVVLGSVTPGAGGLFVVDYN